MLSHTAKHIIFDIYMILDIIYIYIWKYITYLFFLCTLIMTWILYCLSCYWTFEWCSTIFFFLSLQPTNQLPTRKIERKLTITIDVEATAFTITRNANFSKNHTSENVTCSDYSYIRKSENKRLCLFVFPTTILILCTVVFLYIFNCFFLLSHLLKKQ